MNVYLMSSGAGTDAGGTVVRIVNGKLVIERIPGWNPEAMAEMTHALKIVREATFLKTPGLREGALKEVMAFAQKEFAQHIKEGGVVVIG